MKIDYLSFTLSILFLLGVHHATNAETIVTDWKVSDSRSATGVLGEVVVSATASEFSPFVTIFDGRFSGSNWQAPMELPGSVRSIGATDASNGDSHNFSFSPSPGSALFYVENFDSSSVATISLGGEGTIRLLMASQSISFEPTSPSEGLLTTTNTGTNGEGDVIFRLDGGFTSLSIDFADGQGANGVFYTFTAVPEPSTFWCLVVGMVVMMLKRKSG